MVCGHYICLIRTVHTWVWVISRAFHKDQCMSGELLPWHEALSTRWRASSKSCQVDGDTTWLLVCGRAKTVFSGDPLPHAVIQDLAEPHKTSLIHRVQSNWSRWVLISRNITIIGHRDRSASEHGNVNVPSLLGSWSFNLRPQRERTRRTRQCSLLHCGRALDWPGTSDRNASRTDRSWYRPRRCHLQDLPVDTTDRVLCRRNVRLVASTMAGVEDLRSYFCVPLEWLPVRTPTGRHVFRLHLSDTDLQYPRQSDQRWRI